MELKTHELLLFGKSGVNSAWCESVVAHKYLNEYLNLRNAFATNKILSLLNTNNNYNLYKLNSIINGKKHVNSKHINNTRPRHKISLNLDANTTISANTVKPLNYAKYNITTLINNNRHGFFFVKPLNFYSPLNMFNYQTNYSDAKSYIFFKKNNCLQTNISLYYLPLLKLTYNNNLTAHKLFVNIYNIDNAKNITNNTNG